MDETQTVVSTTDGDALARARSVVAVVKANKARIEAARELPAEVVEALHEARLFRLMLPKAVGGDALDLPTFSRVIETLAAADASTAWCVGQGGGCAMSAAYLSPEVARRLFGPRNAVLAWGAGIQGTAVAANGGYRVSGRWTFASGSRHATMLGAHCRIVEADGTPRLRSDGRPADLTALFSRGKARIDDVWQVVGLKGTGSDSYDVQDLFVPAEETVIRDDQDAVGSPEPIFRIPQMHAYAGGFGGVMLGITRATLDDLKVLAAAKTPRGAPSSLAKSVLFQTDLARMEARWRAARALLHTTLNGVWRDVAAGRAFTLDHRIDIRLASTHAINEGVDIVAEAYRAAGQTAIFHENPFEQRLRDAHSASQQVQGRPAHYTTVGCHLLGVPLDTTLFI